MSKHQPVPTTPVDRLRLEVVSLADGCGPSSHFPGEICFSFVDD